jgi:hypothetical protein
MIMISSQNAIFLLLTVVIVCGTICVIAWPKPPKEKKYKNFKEWHIERHAFLYAELRELINDYLSEYPKERLADIPMEKFILHAQLKSLYNKDVDHYVVEWKGNEYNPDLERLMESRDEVP